MPTLYYYDENTQLLEEVENQTINGNVLSATLTHFSKYIVLDKYRYENKWMSYELLYDEDGTSDYKGMDIVFAIDSSGSMADNDSYGVRKTVTKNFIDILTENDRAAIVDLDSYATVYSSFTSDSEALYTAVNKIDYNGGTNLSSAMSEAIDLFTSSTYEGDGRAKYIVMLTDGQGTYSTIYTTKAKENNIVVYTVGLGSGVSTGVLTAIAEGTGGEYYHASNANKLYGVFDAIAEQTDLYKDSDDDGISDYYEKEMNNGNLRLGTGVKLTGINYLQADTDNDNLKDGEEITVNKIGDRVYIILKSNPTTEDTDGDGLLDGKAKMVNEKKVVPRDPEPLKVNGPIGIWQAQYEQEKSGNIAHKLGDWYDADLSSVITGIGSRFLNFKSDDKEIAIHSQVETWQRIFGYNWFYDAALATGTLGNTRNEQFHFSYNGVDFVIWTWRGYYFNLGAGAEIGIYRKRFEIPLKQWAAIDITLPMTLNLYNYYGSDDIKNVFCWAPDDEQWWISGFNPDFDQPKAEEMVVLGTIDFGYRNWLYNSLKEAVKKDPKRKDFMIFDEDGHTVWLILWEAA